MYSDDTNLTFTACSMTELQHDMNVDLLYLQNWLIANRFTLNLLKTEYMLVRFKATKATTTIFIVLLIQKCKDIKRR